MYIIKVFKAEKQLLKYFWAINALDDTIIFLSTILGREVEKDIFDCSIYNYKVEFISSHRGEERVEWYRS